MGRGMQWNGGMSNPHPRTTTNGICNRQQPPLTTAFLSGPHTSLWAPSPSNASLAGGVGNRRATGVCQLRHDRMEQGPTQLRTGCSTFLLSSGGAGGGYY